MVDCPSQPAASNRPPLLSRSFPLAPKEKPRHVAGVDGLSELEPKEEESSILERAEYNNLRHATRDPQFEDIFVRRRSPATVRHALAANNWSPSTKPLSVRAIVVPQFQKKEPRHSGRGIYGTRGSNKARQAAAMLSTRSRPLRTIAAVQRGHNQ
jgi:hypothetical protein